MIIKRRSINKEVYMITRRNFVRFTTLSAAGMLASRGTSGAESSTTKYIAAYDTESPRCLEALPENRRCPQAISNAGDFFYRRGKHWRRTLPNIENYWRILYLRSRLIHILIECCETIHSAETPYQMMRNGLRSSKARRLSNAFSSAPV